MGAATKLEDNIYVYMYVKVAHLRKLVVSFVPALCRRDVQCQ